MQFFIMLVIFVIYVYRNHNKLKKESKIWKILQKSNYSKESACALIAILDEYTNLNPFYVDKNLLKEKTSFTELADYFNQDLKIKTTFLDEIPLGINKFVSSKEKSFLKNLAQENNKGIFDLQI